MEAVSDSIGKLTLSGLMAVVLWGCGAGDELKRERASGDVTLDGSPLRDGTILFEPMSPGVGTAVGGIIRRGHFEIDRARGPVAGEYRVRIYARSDVQAPAREGSSSNKPRPLVELIPEIYNVRSKLRTRIVADGRNSLVYDLSTAEGR